ncbi:type II toxin-antitoxin system VapC family toxin [Thiohalocapsa halophila]|jgi:predicted nucleic acid-binding protein|nr:PIN domain-containing protein [Thiohalocapsa halophila]
MRSTVLVDTGFLVALFDQTDTLHDSAKTTLAGLTCGRRTTLVSVWPTVVETCFFLNPRGKRALLQWIERGALRLRQIDRTDLMTIAAVIERFAEHDIDLADATLVWLAGVEGTRQVLTTDRRDFDMLRTADGQAFERLWVRP